MSTAAFDQIASRVRRTDEADVLVVSLGDARLDLSHSTPAEGEHRVRISGVFGDTTVWLPAGTPFALSAHTLFGGIEANGQHRDGIAPSLSYRMPGFETAVRRITLEISAVFGDITVRA